MQTFLTSIVLVSISSSDYKTDVMSYCKKLYFTNKVFGLTNVPKSKKNNKSPDKKNHLNIARNQELVIDHYNQQ